MTRGRMVITDGTEAYTSTEFNGDMYTDGNGEVASLYLSGVSNFKEFERAVNVFNDTHYDYPERPLVHKVDIDKITKFNKFNYFDNWFSDYLYIKNIGDDTIESTDDTGKTYEFEPGEINVIYFGEFIGTMEPSEEGRLFLKECK